MGDNSWAELEQFWSDVLGMEQNSMDGSTTGNNYKDTCFAAGENKAVEIYCYHSDKKVAAGLIAAPPPPPPVESDEYGAYLRRRLHFECTAVALIRAKEVEVKNAAAAGPVQVNSTDEGWESEDEDEKTLTANGDEEDGKAETTQNDYAGTANRTRKKGLNRDSARRLRMRKQEQRTGLQARVEKLRSEKTDLVKKLTELIDKQTREAATNRNLKSHVEELRSQVKKLEEFFAKAARISSAAAARDNSSSPLGSSQSATMGMPEEQPGHHIPDAHSRSNVYGGSGGLG